MKIQDFTIGQAVEYYSHDLGDYRPTWKHGHVCEIEARPHFPLVFIDTTMHDYRPQGKAVEPHRVRPATTECTATAVCQEAPKWD